MMPSQSWLDQSGLEEQRSENTVSYNNNCMIKANRGTNHVLPQGPVKAMYDTLQAIFLTMKTNALNMAIRVPNWSLIEAMVVILFFFPVIGTKILNLILDSTRCLQYLYMIIFLANLQHLQTLAMKEKTNRVLL